MATLLGEPAVARGASHVAPKLLAECLAALVERDATLDLREQVIARQLEGVMSKRLTSGFLPGRRSDAWLKIKPR